MVGLSDKYLIMPDLEPFNGKIMDDEHGGETHVKYIGTL